MSQIFGTNDQLCIEDDKDSEGELEVSMSILATDSESVSSWLNRDDAIKVVEHLQKVFDI